MSVLTTSARPHHQVSARPHAHPDALLVAASNSVAHVRAEVCCRAPLPPRPHPPSPQVQRRTGYTLSAGIAKNKMLAKLISGTSALVWRPVLTSH